MHLFLLSAVLLFHLLFLSITEASCHFSLHQISLDLTDLLIYLDDTTIGSLLIKDFRIEQLILKDGTLKLTDLDDLDGRRKLCKTDRDCTVGGLRLNTTLPCKYQRCENYSKTLNLYNLNKIFLDYSLNFDNPAYVSEDLKALAQRLAAFNIGLVELWRELNRVAWKIKSGIYAKRFINAGKSHLESISPGPAFSFHTE